MAAHRTKTDDFVNGGFSFLAGAGLLVLAWLLQSAAVPDERWDEGDTERATAEVIMIGSNPIRTSKGTLAFVEARTYRYRDYHGREHEGRYETGKGQGTRHAPLRVLLDPGQRPRIEIEYKRSEPWKSRLAADGPRESKLSRNQGLAYLLITWGAILIAYAAFVLARGCLFGDVP
jgi:hypothetical protein